MNRSVLGSFLLAASLGAAAGTRLPGEGWTAYASAGLALAVAGLGIASLRQRRAAWIPAATLLAFVALLATPTSAQGALDGIPPAIVALLVAAFLHVLYRSHHLDAPRLQGSNRRAGLRDLGRGLPLAALLALVALLPWLATVALPDRLASAFELRGAAGPLVAAAAMVTLVLAWAWLRAGLAATPAAASDPAQSDGAGVGP